MPMLRRCLILTVCALLPARAQARQTPAPAQSREQQVAQLFRDAAGQPIDQGLALYFPAPHSYTGEDVLELQAHGGPVVLQLLLARCLEAAATVGAPGGAALLAGLRLAQPGEFTERAFLNDKIDLAQAEAIADLIAADIPRGSEKTGRAGLDAVLTERGVDIVTFRDWQKIEAAEVTRAREGAPREKFATIAEMLDART